MYRLNRYIPAGDRALIVECGDGISPETAGRVRSMHYAIEGADIQGVVECIPTYKSVLVIYDPLRIGLEALVGALRDLGSRLHTLKAPDPIVTEIPVAYGGEHGPDLEYVASHTGLTPGDFIRMHCSPDYLIYMLGFTAGQPYLGGMPEVLNTPRRKDPRLLVPAGSVGIAGSQTGIYPVDSPGGWQLVGRTPVKLYDPKRDPCILLRAGDYVRFVPVSPAEFERIRVEVEKGTYEPRVHEWRPGNAVDTSTLKDVDVPGVDTAARRAPAQPAPVRRAGGGGGAQDAAPLAGPVDVFEVLDGGLQTTVQDWGRFGYQQMGVPPSGAMDRLAFSMANLLVGNRREAAGLEITYTGPVLRALRDTVIAITGADFHPVVNSTECPQWESVHLRQGDVLEFGLPCAGCRAYLGVAGGVLVPSVMGSRSTYLKGRIGGIEGRSLAAGDRVAIAAPGRSLSPDDPPQVSGAGWSVPRRFRPRYSMEWVVRAVPGPQEGRFSERGLNTFFSEPYVVGEQSDRMGIRLKGPVIEHNGGADIVSDAVPPGAVQVPGTGHPIIMLADRQTTGGYAKIACVSESDLDVLGQARIGDTVRFRPVTVEESHQALRHYQELIREVERGIYQKYVRPRTLLIHVAGTVLRADVEDIVEE